MAVLSTKLHSVSLGGSGSGISFWCPGCNASHSIRTGGTGGLFHEAKWNWDGNVNSPTVTPSILIKVNFAPEDDGPTVCHSTITAGQITFLSDSTHSLKGQTVALPDWPV